MHTFKTQETHQQKKEKGYLSSRLRLLYVGMMRCVYFMSFACFYTVVTHFSLSLFQPLVPALPTPLSFACLGESVCTPQFSALLG